MILMNTIIMMMGMMIILKMKMKMVVVVGMVVVMISNLIDDMLRKSDKYQVAYSASTKKNVCWHRLLIEVFVFCSAK